MAAELCNPGNARFVLLCDESLTPESMLALSVGGDTERKFHKDVLCDIRSVVLYGSTEPRMVGSSSVCATPVSQDINDSSGTGSFNPY